MGIRFQKQKRKAIEAALLSSFCRNLYELNDVTRVLSFQRLFQDHPRLSARRIEPAFLLR